MLRTILADEIPNLVDLSAPFCEQEIDSFGLVALRARVEQFLQRQISDEQWSAIQRPSDILAMEGHRATNIEALQSPTIRPASRTRNHSLNMPQMAMGGLSESWLLKELGDLHWSMIASGLGKTSSTITDGEGNRLYATFTRLSYFTYKSLSDFRENETLSLTDRMTRVGSGTFISEIEIGDGLGDFGAASLLSNFSRRGGDSNASLLKGQPVISADCPIPDTTSSSVIQEYRDRRASEKPPSIYSTEYEIVPFHDINGVGLLYFAAYPIISDICTARYRPEIATDFSTTKRDIYYFTNAEPTETLVLNIHKWDETPERIDIETSISRKSDGVTMGYIITRKRRV